MARRNKENTQKNDFARFEIKGTITEIYEGRKADYLTVRAYDGDFYSDFNVSVDPEKIKTEYDEGDTIKARGKIRKYYNKNANMYKVVFQAEELETEVK